MARADKLLESTTEPRAAQKPRRTTMKTLNIKDLPVTEELDRHAMSAVRGGYSLFWPAVDISHTDLSFEAQQLIGQTQNTSVNTGVNVAFAQNIKANVKPTQIASNSNTVNIGAPMLS
jgi:hypothetical protein